MLKNKLTITCLLALVASGVVFAQVESLRGTDPIEDMNAIPTVKHVPKNQDRMALNYVNQPPLIPHAVKGYQINQSNNSCLNCHDVDSYTKTGATRISPSHFIDRDGKVLTKVAANRYFCRQCHVPQISGKPLIDNTFKPAGKFGQ